MTARDKLIVALDFGTAAEALRLADQLESRCRWVKVGMELFYGRDGGPAIVKALRTRGYEIFLDLKLHDIPNTVAGAVRSLQSTGAALLTVHAAGGEAMLAAAQGALRGNTLQLLAVTVLTSMDAEHLRAVGVHDTPGDQVLRLGRLAHASGVAGLVCSAEEVRALRSELGAEPLLVVPGIRPAGAAHGDQRRVAGPAEALARGASMLVVGRPITQAADPVAATDNILRAMGGALTV